MGWRGEGVVMDAELEVSGESIVGSRGAGLVSSVRTTSGMASIRHGCETVREPCLLFATGLAPIAFLASSSSDLKLEPKEPSEMSGSVLPFARMVESFEPLGELIRAVKDVGAMLPAIPTPIISRRRVQVRYRANLKAVTGFCSV